MSRLQEESPHPRAGDDEALYPVTAGQERHWFLHRYEEDASTQNVSAVVELIGPHTEAGIAAAARTVVASHPQIHQRFLMTDGGLRARRIAGAWDELRVVDVGSAAEADIRQAALQAQRNVLDIEQGPSCVLYLLIAGDRRFLCVSMHACVADCASARLLLQEIGALLAGTPVERPVTSSACAPMDADGGDPAQGLRYWTQRLGDEPPALELPLQGPRPHRKRYDGGRSVAPVPRDLAARIAGFCEERRCSVAAVYLAAWVAVLHRWSRQETLIVGRHVDLRAPEQRHAIGRYENVVPFRVDFAETWTFDALVREVEDRLRKDADHQGLPVEELLKHLPGSRDPSRNPLFQAGFGYRTGAAAGLSQPPSSLVAAPELERTMTPLDVDLRIEHRHTTTLTLLFDEVLFDARSISRLPRHCLKFLGLGLREPESLVTSINLLDADEQAEQLRRFNTPHGPASTSTIPDLFARAVQRHRDTAAVAFGDRRLSYHELDDQSDRVARALQRLGAGSGACVGVCLDRSVEMVVAVLGILKSGAAYVPMDPAYPEERLGLMVADSAAPFVVAHRNHAGRFPESVRVVPWQEIAEQARHEHAAGAPVPDPESLAYVIFTSGSTGRPKGVAMPHRALVNLVEWQLQRETFRPGARVLQYSSLSFDVSFQEIFTTWVSGGTLHLIEDEHRRDPRRLLSALAKDRIQRLFLPSVALRQMIEVAHASARYPESLEEIITAGEQLRVDDAVRSFFGHVPGASLDNQYGPSETHVVTAHLLQGDSSRWPDLPPIGRPIRNNRAYILDDHRQLVPAGVTGELYLSGVNLARGYLGRDDLTRERFVGDPFGPPGARMYRTGDLARYRPDGCIDFLGRADSQVKVRGHRIEPGEIDAVLAELPAVKQSLTKAFDDPKLGRRLVAYVLVDDPAGFDVAHASSRARERLPEYMVPSVIMPLATLPFTPSGKVDMRALPDPAAAPMPENPSRVHPATPIEQSLADLWQEMLGLPEVGTNESFFDLGGDSLKAVDLFLAIERRFGRDLPLSVLAERSTIQGLARVIEGGTDDHGLSDYRSLRMIQAGDPGANPLFLVHGGGGNVVLFKGLARQLPADLPVYAFQWDGWNGGRGRTSIESMAALYLDELRRLRPRGPYRLGGHCIGGMIALEMARRLRRDGDELEGPLILTDTPNLGARCYEPVEPAPGSAGADALASLREELERRVTGAGISVPGHTRARAYRPRHGLWYGRAVRGLRKLHRGVLRTDLPRQTIETFLDRSFVRLLRLTGRRIPIDYREAYAAMTMVRAIRAYRPEPYDGDVLLFRTRLLVGSTLGIGGWWRTLHLGFDELCAGRLTTHFIATTHNAVIQHPLTARIISQALGI